MAYRLEYRSSVRKELRQLDQADLAIVIGKIEALAADPRPEGSAKLKGSRDLYRIRHGDCRIVYQIQKSVLVVLIIRVGHRREIYKKL